MNRWHDRSEEIEHQLEALRQADFGLSYSNELLTRVLTAFGLHVHMGGEPGRPFSALIGLGGEPLTASPLPGAVARILFDDAKLVFDIRARLQGVSNVQAALIGAPPGVEPENDKETLIEFVARNPSCIVVFDDPQAFDPWAIRTLADMCRKGYLANHRRKLTLKEVIIIATARVSLPPPTALHVFAQTRPEIEDDLLIDWSTGRLDQFSFRRTVKTWLDVNYPEHLSNRLQDPFDRIVLEHLWQRYIRGIEEGEVEVPILTITDPTSATWESQRVCRQANSHRDAVRDLKKLIPKDYPRDMTYDIFISYRTGRDKEAAEWLYAALTKLEFSVFLDTKTLNLADHPEEEMKARLITEIVTLVLASRCTIAFAMGIEPFELPSGMTEDEAVRRALAMRGYDGNLIKWNWQKLETDYSREVLYLDRTTGRAYQTSDGIVAESFGMHTFESNDEMLEIAWTYLRSIVIRG